MYSPKKDNEKYYPLESIVNHEILKGYDKESTYIKFKEDCELSKKDSEIY